MRALTCHKVNATFKKKKKKNTTTPWLFSCSVIKIKTNMHILWSAAEPQLEGNGGFSEQWNQRLVKKKKEKKMVALWFWCIMVQLRPPKDIQGRSWNEKKKRKRRASLSVSVIKLGTKLECVCGVFCLTPPFTSPSVDTIVRYDWRSETVLLKEPGAFICEELKDWIGWNTYKTAGSVV